MKRKQSFFWLILLLSFSSLLYAAKPRFATNYISPDINQILQRGKIIVAIPDLDDTIFFTKSDKPLQGLEVDNAKKLAEALGVSVEFNREAKTFNDIPDIIAQGKADVAICDLSRSLSRAQKVLYTKPYITYHTALLVSRLWLAQQNVGHHPPRPAPVILQENGYTIGTLYGTSNDELAHSIFPKAKIETFATAEDLFSAIKEEKINVVLYDDFFIKRILFEDPALALRYKIVVLQDHPDYIGMVVAINHPHLLHWLDIYIDSSNITWNSDKLIDYYMKHKN